MLEDIEIVRAVAEAFKICKEDPELAPDVDFTVQNFGTLALVFLLAKTLAQGDLYLMGMIATFVGLILKMFIPAATAVHLLDPEVGERVERTWILAGPRYLLTESEE